MATHSSVLAWRIPGTGEPGGLPSMWSQSQTRLKRLSSSSRGECTIPDFAPNTLFSSLLFRSGSWILWSFCVVLSIICPNCPYVYLFVVPYHFFVFCCLRRHLSRRKHCSNWSRSQPGTKVVWHLERCKRLYPWWFGWRKKSLYMFLFYLCSGKLNWITHSLTLT